MPLQSEAAASLLAGLPEGEWLETWRLARTDGSLTGYGAGIPELLVAMRATRRAGRVLGRAPEPVLEALYSAISRHRGALGRLAPAGPGPSRFP